MIQVSPGRTNPLEFQRAMVFIDGTNLFHRLDDAKLKLSGPIAAGLAKRLVTPRQLVAVYLYTLEDRLKRARGIHGPNVTDGVRVAFGHPRVKADGSVEEKGVDALLVADAVYHAAQRNFEFGVFISADTDFEYVIKRVHDFGCRTRLVGIAAEVADRLKGACDEYLFLSKQELLSSGLVTEIS